MASPFTYEQMRTRQKALNSQMLPPEPDENAAPADDTTGAAAAGIDSTVLNTPALDDSIPDAAPVAAATESTATPKPVTGFDEKRAKRAVVLKSMRNSEHGVELFANHIRSAYGVSRDFKASPSEIISAGFRLQQKTIPDLTADEYVKAMHKLYGEKVDRRILEQARTDYPGHANEDSLIEEMYKRKVSREEAGNLSWADKAQIVARRYPQLHASDMEPEKALRQVYTVQKKKGKNVGSFDDWMHSQMAPTLAERGYGAAGGILNALKEQGISIGKLAQEATDTPRVATDVGLALRGGDTPEANEARDRLKEAGMGAANVAALAAGAGVRAGLGALEGGLGVAKTAPMLAGAAEGAGAGAVQGGAQAAIEGKSLGEIAQEAATNAGLGGAVGGVLEGVHARGASKAAAVAKAEAEAADEAAKAAGSANLPAEAPAAPVRAPETNPLELAAQHDREARFTANVRAFADEHGMDPETAMKLVSTEKPDMSDLAAAASRYGVSADDIAELRSAMPEHMVEQSAPTPGNTEVPSATPAPTETPTAAAEPGRAQGPMSEKMTEALKRAQDQLPARARMRRQALSERLGAARAVGEKVGGLAGFRAKLGMMAGEIRKPEWEGVKDLFSDVDANELHNAIMRSNMLEGDKLTAGHGLNRLLGIGGTRMGAPTKSQIEALRLAFGSKFVDQVERNPSLARKLHDMWSKTLNTPRTAMTTLDISMGGRQGYLMASQPEYRRAFKDMVHAFGDTKVEQEVADSIKKSPLYDVKRESGLHLQGEPFQTKSEQFAGSWISNWTGVKNSEAAANTFLNKVRSDMFDRVYNDYAKAGVDVTDPHFRQSLAKWLNTGTGRGDFSWFGRDANVFNAVMFSPRLFYSRIETFNPAYYASLHPAVRSAALRANANVVGGTMALLSGLGMSGVASVGLDPRNSDFAKAKVGNTRIDLFAGHQQIARVMAQLLTGKVISSTTGREIDLNGSDAKNGFARGSMTRADVIARFMEAKASPLASLAIALARGQDFTGAPISVPNEVISRLTPMVIEDAADAFKDAGLQRAALVAPLALSGIGTQTYSANLPGEKKANEGVVMSTGHWLVNKLNDNAEDDDLPRLHAQLAEQWVKDAAMAQVSAHQEATQTKGFFDKGFDQKSAIRKATARRMARVNKLYKDLSGANGEDKRVAAEQAMLERRADATGMNIDALRNPNVYSEVSK